MTRTATIIDIEDIPELRRIVDEARASGRASVLRLDDRDVAILTPIRPEAAGGRTAGNDDDATFSSAFGGWEGIVDGEKLKRDMREARGSDRPVAALDE
jgi:hypothetical protein